MGSRPNSVHFYNCVLIYKFVQNFGINALMQHCLLCHFLNLKYYKCIKKLLQLYGNLPLSSSSVADVVFSLPMATLLDNRMSTSEDEQESLFLRIMDSSNFFEVLTLPPLGTLGDSGCSWLNVIPGGISSSVEASVLSAALISSPMFDVPAPSVPPIASFILLFFSKLHKSSNAVCCGGFLLYLMCLTSLRSRKPSDCVPICQ